MEYQVGKFVIKLSNIVSKTHPPKKLYDITNVETNESKTVSKNGVIKTLNDNQLEIEIPEFLSK